MFLLLLKLSMAWIKLILTVIGVFLVQFFLTELLAISTIRPDFIMIMILYVGITHGSFYGVLAGFTAGLLVDLAGVGSYFGLTPLTCSVTGYLSGYLQGQHLRLVPMYYHGSWLAIVALHFLIFAFVRYQFLFETNMSLFWMKWALTCGYTLGFIAILQFVLPITKVSHAES